jgi:signal transduction histidine kinase
MRRFQTRVLLPVVAVSACLVVLCALTAASLFAQQSAITGVLRENVSSRRAAAELRGTLNVLVELEHRHVENVDDLNAQAQASIRSVRQFADQWEERRLAEQLEAGFAAYLKRWEAIRQTLPVRDPRYDGVWMTAGSLAEADARVRHDAAVAEAVRLLETEVLLPCRDYEVYNDRRVEDSTAGLELTLGQLAWGMAGIGLLGATAGVVLGYGLARVVRRSIRGIQVRLRDAAGQLGAAADVTLTEDGDFGGLHDAIDQLSARIADVVERLQQREREVRRAEQLASLGQLAAGVAHEIRNPLTSIKMLVQSGQDGETLTGEDLRVIEAEVRRMEGSLRTFLDFARPAKAERRPTELVGAVRGAFDLLRPRAERQGVGLVLRADGPVTVPADPSQLHQVLVNLGLNALDVMPGGGTLTVVVRPTPGGAEAAVSDTGPGVRADVLPRLFQPFVSGKDTGLGLGLVIAKRIAEDHGGTLTGGNAPGGGARFVLTLSAHTDGGGHA